MEERSAMSSVGACRSVACREISSVMTKAAIASLCTLLFFFYTSNNFHDTSQHGRHVFVNGKKSKTINRGCRPPA